MSCQFSMHNRSVRLSQYAHRLIPLGVQDPKASAAAAGTMVVSPLTGEMVPLDQMAEHMRINLIDPRCALRTLLSGTPRGPHPHAHSHPPPLLRRPGLSFSAVVYEVSASACDSLQGVLCCTHGRS